MALCLKRRESGEILVQLLTTAGRGAGATKTALVYKSNLNFTRCEKYMDLLVQKRLIEAARVSPDAPVIYKITTKGREALEALLNVKELLFGEEQVELEGDNFQAPSLIRQIR